MSNNNEKKKSGLRAGLLITMCVCLLALVTAAGMLCYTYQNGLQVQLVGDAAITQEYNEPFQDPGTTANFNGFFYDETSVPVTVTGAVDTDKLGDYTLTYSSEYVLDLWLFTLTCQASQTRIVTVVDTQAPEIELHTNPDYFTLPGGTYVEEGYTAVDNHDGDITDAVVRTQTDEQVSYKATDTSGNTTEVVRPIVYSDPVAPEVTLLGAPHIMLRLNARYEEAGYTAVDNMDGDLTQQVTVSGEVDTGKEGIYTVTYSAQDSFGNIGTAQRTIFVSKVPVVPGLPHTQYEDPLPNNGKVIYMTFDDGPSEHTPKLLDILKKYNVKATFFVVYSNNKEMLKRMVDEGHTVANHSATHDYDIIYSSTGAYWNDLRISQDRIEEATGIRSMMVRFPGGSSNSASIEYCPGIMTELVGEMESKGYRYFDWHVSSKDAGVAHTRDEVYYYSVSGIAERKESYTVLLQHDITSFSVEAAELIIQWGIANGYTFEALTMESPRCQHRIFN